MVQIEILIADEVVHVYPVGPQPTHVGRAPTNDLVLADARVSARHVVVWTEAEAVWIEDVGSRNGTVVDEAPVTGRTRVAPGAVVVLGGSVRFRVAGDPGPLVVAIPALHLVDTRSGVQVPVRTDRFTIGSHSSRDLVLPGGPELAATVLVYPHEIWLGLEDATLELTIGAPFDVAGHALVLEADAGVLARTEGLDQVRYAYRLDVWLDGPSGPGATLRDRVTGVEHPVTSETRVALLYVLAQKLSADLADGVPADERGWMHDDDVATGVWGRERLKLDPNNFHVLVHRLRREIARSGFDPWFLEKKRRHLRLRLGDVGIR